ncbi:MAG TPA: mechanosensitive ion channel domain-containing protein [Phycisphaerales bacterium]|nr:mechanosensitive ion channel domain-containing protein [Phycisphaerales bacterium]
MFVFDKLLSVLVLAQAAGEGTTTTTTTTTTSGFDWKVIGEKAGALLTEYGLRVVGALIFLIGAWILSAWLVRAMVRGLTKAKVDVTLSKFLANLARWALLVLVVIACLGIFGVPATSFVTVLGTVGLAIGLGVQGSLSHLAAGVMLMIFRPFRVGDAVVVAGQAGVVDEIELFSTRLDTGDNRRVIIPNAQVFGSIIINVTHHEVRKVEVNVGVGYAADVDQTRTTLLRAASGLEGLAPGRPVDAVIQNLSASSVDWTVAVWAPNATYGAVRQQLVKRVKEELERAGIDIPYPQMVVHTPAFVGRMAGMPELGRNGHN